MGGWTLMDVVLSVAVSGVLAAAAVPRLQEQVLRSRRPDAWAALAALELAQERHRMDRGRYAADLAELGMGGQSAGGHYGLVVAQAHALGYRVMAQARGGSIQEADTPCLFLAVERAGAELHRLSGPRPDALTVDTANRCWPR